MLRYLALRAIPGVEAVQLDAGEPSYLRSVRMGDKSGWLRITHLPLRQQIAVELAPFLSSLLMPLLARVRSQFDLDAHPDIIEAHLRHDPLLASRVNAMQGLRVPGAFDAFELAVRAVLGQQVSVAGATTLCGRLVQRFGDAATSPHAQITHHFPQAATLAEMEPSAIAAIGIPGARARTISGLSRLAADGGLQMAPGTSLGAALACLKSVPGIGDWTAHYIALRALRFPDAFPAGDLGLQKAAAGNGGRLTENQLAARAQAWSPWRGYAAIALWMNES
jgi:AraC family transcriptional regulator of adaptative response / DNA-3-methyladenine glycosylase II